MLALLLGELAPEQLSSLLISHYLHHQQFMAFIHNSKVCDRNWKPPIEQDAVVSLRNFIPILYIVGTDTFSDIALLELRVKILKTLWGNKIRTWCQP